MSDGFSMLQGLAGGGVGAVVLGSLFLLYKCFQGRSCHSKSGCISLDLSSPKGKGESFEHTNQHYAHEIPTARTPAPSLEVKVNIQPSEQGQHL
jgi:hypothetical protein